MFDRNWKTTGAFYKFPLCILNNNKEFNTHKPYIRDCVRFRTIVLRLMFSSPEAHDSLLEEFPFLGEMPRRRNRSAPYDDQYPFRYTEINTPRFDRLRSLMPRLKELYTKLVLVGVEWE